MSSQENLRPNLCLTAAGILIHEGKVLLIKHKKLGVWLAPGGHIELNEMPHQAAEREFWEETGVRATTRITGFPATLESTDSALGNGFVPTPFLASLHWVSKENYEARTQANPELAYQRKYTERACEQHVGYTFLMEPVDTVEFAQNREETDGIAWFAPSEIATLDTNEMVKLELQEAFRLHIL